MNDYHPMTANEAGEESTKSLLERVVTSNAARQHVDVEAWADRVAEKAFPSKPCTENGDHCFCARDEIQHAMINHEDRVCCWCNEPKCVQFAVQRVPGHGPYRTELVRE